MPINAWKKTQMSFQNFLSVLVVVYCSCWFMHRQIHLGSCCGHFCSFRVSICCSSTYDQDSELLSILQSQAFRAFLWHGYRSTWQWSVRNVTKSRRFARTMFFIVLFFFFFIFCMFSLKMNSREILVCFSSLYFFAASVLRRFKMIELPEFGDCLRGLFTREMTLLFNAYSGLKACECLSYSEFFIP